MLRDITLGQYYPADSVIHKLDPRVKLFSTMIYIISLFCFRGVAALAIATVFLITVIKLSKVPFKFMVKGLKAIMILMLITAVFNLFLTPGEALVSVWRFTITKEGVTSAVLMAIRLTYLILGTSIMTLTTTPNQLTDGLEKALMPLSKIGVPVLILDEPTAGLDPAGRDEILDLVARMHRERNMTVILVSHSMEDVAKYVERIIVMNHGQVMFDDTPKEVFRHYKELETIGLAAPQVTYLMHELKEHGLSVDTEATTVEEARASLMQALTGIDSGRSDIHR